MTTQTFTVTISLPVRDLAQNSRCHWTKRSEATKLHRLETKLRTIAVLSRLGVSTPVQKVRVSSEWFMGHIKPREVSSKFYRPTDPLNCWGALKAAFDGLADSGLIPNDSRKHLEVGSVKMHRTAKEHKGRCAVDLIIEVIES